MAKRTLDSDIGLMTYHNKVLYCVCGKEAVSNHECVISCKKIRIEVCSDSSCGKCNLKAHFQWYNDLSTVDRDGYLVCSQCQLKLSDDTLPFDCECEDHSFQYVPLSQLPISEKIGPLCKYCTRCNVRCAQCLTITPFQDDCIFCIYKKQWLVEDEYTFCYKCDAYITFGEQCPANCLKYVQFGKKYGWEKRKNE